MNTSDRLRAINAELLEVAEMVENVIQQWRVSGREPAYHQWIQLQTFVRAAIAKAKA